MRDSTGDLYSTTANVLPPLIPIQWFEWFGCDDSDSLQAERDAWDAASDEALAGFEDGLERC